jgi:hypothetical protein
MLGPHTHGDNPVSRIMCATVVPPGRCVTLRKFQQNITTFLFFLKQNSIPRVKMVKRSDKTNTGEGDKGKKSRTVSDDSGGKSLSDTSTSAGVKSTVIRTSVNIFEVSKRDKPQYFVDKVKDKRRTKNNLWVTVSDTVTHRYDFLLMGLGVRRYEIKRTLFPRRFTNGCSPPSTHHPTFFTSVSLSCVVRVIGIFLEDFFFDSMDISKIEVSDRQTRSRILKFHLSGQHFDVVKINTWVRNHK